MGYREGSTQPENDIEQEFRKIDGRADSTSEPEIAFATESADRDVEKMETDDKFDASRVENATDTESPDSIALEGSEASHQSKRWAIIGTIYQGLSWTPRTCRYDPENPPKFSLAMNFLFAFVGPKVYFRYTRSLVS